MKGPPRRHPNAARLVNSSASVPGSGVTAVLPVSEARRVGSSRNWSVPTVSKSALAGTFRPARRYDQ